MISGRVLMPVDPPDETSGALRVPHVPRPARGSKKQIFTRQFGVYRHIQGDFRPESCSIPHRMWGVWRVRITGNHTGRQGGRRAPGISWISRTPPAGPGSVDLGGMGGDWPADARIRGRYGRILSVVEGGAPGAGPCAPFQG